LIFVGDRRLYRYDLASDTEAVVFDTTTGADCDVRGLALIPDGSAWQFKPTWKQWVEKLKKIVWGPALRAAAGRDLWRTSGPL
jgi:hypothetical protein